MGSEKKGKPVQVTLELSERTWQRIQSQAEQTHREPGIVASELLERVLGDPAADRHSVESVLAALDRISERARTSPYRRPPGTVVDDSREAMYEGRDE